jgi:hypothetical protein
MNPGSALLLITTKLAEAGVEVGEKWIMHMSDSSRIVLEPKT